MTDFTAIDLLCSRHDRGEIDNRPFLNELAALLAQSIGCSRAGVRVALETSSGSVLRTLAMYELSASRLIDVPDLAGDGVQRYLRHLGRQGDIVAPDVTSHSDLPALLGSYVNAYGVRSLMDVGVSLNGSLLGTLSCEQLHERCQWSPRQVHLLRYFSERASSPLVAFITGQPTPPGAPRDHPHPELPLPLP
jgi:GAF domain-containing protein